MTAWVPLGIALRVRGVIPTKLLSINTFAPAGVEETDTSPTPALGPEGWRIALTSETVFA